MSQIIFQVLRGMEVFFLLYLLLLQNLGIPDCVALGIQNNLGGGRKESWH